MLKRQTQVPHGCSQGLQLNVGKSDEIPERGTNVEEMMDAVIYLPRLADVARASNVEKSRNARETYCKMLKLLWLGVCEYRTMAFRISTSKSRSDIGRDEESVDRKVDIASEAKSGHGGRRELTRFSGDMEYGRDFPWNSHDRGLPVSLLQVPVLFIFLCPQHGSMIRYRWIWRIFVFDAQLNHSRMRERKGPDHEPDLYREIVESHIFGRLEMMKVELDCRGGRKD